MIVVEGDLIAERLADHWRVTRNDLFYFLLPVALSHTQVAAILRLNRSGVCQTLKVLREQAGLTQADLSKKTTLCKRTVERWESGEREPSATEALAIAQVLGQDTRVILAAIAASRQGTKQPRRRGRPTPRRRPDKGPRMGRRESGCMGSCTRP
jgi:DNA-binding XRE family transcriptional regulator